MDSNLEIWSQKPLLYQLCCEVLVRHRLLLVLIKKTLPISLLNIKNCFKVKILYLKTWSSLWSGIVANGYGDPCEGWFSPELKLLQLNYFVNWSMSGCFVFSPFQHLVWFAAAAAALNQIMTFSKTQRPLLCKFLFSQILWFFLVFKVCRTQRGCDQGPVL